MAWGKDFPWGDIAQRLIETRLRAERLRLVHRLQSLEARAVARGASPLPLKELLNAVTPKVPLAPDRIDRALVLPRKAAGYWRKRFVTVKPKPGSVF